MLWRMAHSVISLCDVTQNPPPSKPQLNKLGFFYTPSVNSANIPRLPLLLRNIPSNYLNNPTSKFPDDFKAF